MSTRVSWKGDALPNGAFTAGSVGTGDTAPSNVTGGGALTLADPSHGTRGPVIRIQQVPGAAAFSRWDWVTGDTECGFRVYWDPEAALAPNHTIVQLYDTVAGATVLRVNVNDTKRVNLYNAASTLRKQSAADLIPPGTRYRIEGKVNCDTDVAEIRFFAGESATPILVLTDTSNFGAQVNRIYLGNHLISPTAEVMEFDDLVVTNVFALPGGLASPALDLEGTDTFVVDATGSTAGAGGALTYGITQLSGTTTAPVSLGSGRWSITRHATDTLVYRVTVTEAGAATDSDTIEIGPIGSGPGGDSVELLQLVAGAWV